MESQDEVSVNGQGERNRTTETKSQIKKKDSHADTVSPIDGSSRKGKYSNVKQRKRFGKYSHSEFMGMVRRVKNQVSKRWDIWKPEIDLLLIIALFVQMHERRMTFNKSDLFDFAFYKLPSAQAKAGRKIDRLLSMGYLMQVRYKPTNGIGLAMTEKALELIEDFDNECKLAEAWYYKKKELRRLKDCVIYLDRVKQLLTTFQEPIFTDEQRQKIAQMGV